jgi:hypothetical protein
MSLDGKEIKHNEKSFLQKLNLIYNDIGGLLFNIANGIDYDDEKTKRLFRVSKEWDKD